LAEPTLQAYLDRIKFEGRARPDRDTLTRVHRGHVENIAYENLDVQFGCPVSRDLPATFDKLVARRRGGWCYEMNGLMDWALREIGFKVTRMAGGVARSILGDVQIGNHLVLCVDLDRRYIADVGFGDGLIEPVPIVPGEIRQRFLAFALEDMGQGWWRFHNDARGGAPSFDFKLEPAEEALLDRKCAWLQSDAASPFVLNAVVQRHRPDCLVMMRGRTLKTVSRDTETRIIESADDYVDTLNRVFGIDLPEARNLWPKIEARHRELFGPQS
jgi:N-hydroxyarylamine O-acetyltransferase